MWAALGKTLLKGTAKKIAKDKLLNRKKKTNKRRMSVKKIMGRDDEQKKGGALAVRPTMDLVGDIKDFDPVSDTSGETDIVIIRKQLIQVRDILKDSYTVEQAERVKQRKARQTDKRNLREDKIEKPKVEPKAAKAGIKMPNLGLGIGNFLTWLIAGLIFNKLKDLMPTLKKIFGVLKAITSFIGGVLKKTLEFVIGFIDLSYAGVEKLREGMVAIGGEGAGELFDKFGKLFTQVINGALIAALIGARVGLFKGPKGPKNPKGPKGPKPKWQKNLQKWWKKTKMGKFLRNQKAGRIKLMRKFARSRVGKVLNALRPKNVGKFIMEGGVDKALKGGVKNLIKTTPKLANFKGGVKNLIKTTPKLAKTVTQAGLKTVSSTLKAAKKIISPIVKRIPFIGALIDFALNYFVFKEPLGRSAFMAIGAGVGAWIGGMLGTLIPVPFVGTAIGTFLGGMGGDKLGGFIYDGIFASKETPDPLKDDIDDIDEKVKGNSENILPQKTQIKSQGLDTHPSYAMGGFIVVENTTTYIQPIEV